MKQVSLKNFNNCNFGRNVTIKGDKIIINEGVTIGDNVRIEAKEILIGYDTIIEKETQVMGLGKPMDCFKLGDNTFIGFSNQILVPRFEMLDYSQLHNSGLHNGYEALTIGYNCWIGQNTILNSTKRLKIGNNVRIGTQSQLWTHVASGELLEGCTLFGMRPLILKDNVWIVGGAVISPGLVLGKNSIIMTGAVLTKNTEPHSTYGGVPAVNITSKLNFWKKISIDEKFQLMEQFIEEFVAKFPSYKNIIYLEKRITKNDMKKFNKECIVIYGNIDDDRYLSKLPASFFCLETKRYTKKRTKIEIDWIKYNIGYRARFIPF